MRVAWDGINKLFNDRVFQYLVEETNKIAAAVGKAGPPAAVTMQPTLPRAPALPESVSIGVASGSAKEAQVPKGGGSGARLYPEPPAGAAQPPARGQLPVSGKGPTFYPNV